MSIVTALPVAELTDRIEEIFRKAGLSIAQSAAIARVIAAGEQDACKSHGIYRIEGCLRTLKAGKVVPCAEPVAVADGSAIVRVDARQGFAPLAFEIGLPHLVERTRALGLAALVINDCTHFSALWPEVEALTERGLAGLALCPSYSAVAPAGGQRPLFGTNPMAFGWPRPSGAPYVFDFATSMVARGEIELHRRAGQPIPEGWAIDTEGAPATDPERALAGALLPFGGHKGSAISTMIELLGGPMIGDFTSAEALGVLGSTSLLPRHGELILAFDVEQFARGRPGDPLARAEVLFDAILGQGARLPSQRRFAARARTEVEGIPLTAAELEQLDRFARLGLDALP
ncbi:Ureidoglycolate/malate/sulfolactate dehydrogenase family [Rubellimicrobium mesophilum DSM 19309]|uniref:Ureidoglycolate/malate/sulfolactate dehydrogenase family n=1 Tax=Rubellimicrobium mesophilum DSM 19309 TaxID=442562 RepID=A0A017HT13_9RHOB|nr:Ldh family oxidoreductase [Rubellimicrobium mesophilum]EYD77465.1 Ureidoglycolate/malate/sulfolactate dehydrogenase family [Rubellimicrobium mesophilum DSM 19309]